MAENASQSTSNRIASLDQFRGYTVLGMFFVNFIAGFVALPAFFKHHNTYCSYADTIMPQFFFAVGFSYRLTLLRRLQTEGARAAYGHVAWRCLGLTLLGLVVYHVGGHRDTWARLQEMTLLEFLNEGLRREPFQTLVHIAVTSLWVMPVMARSIQIRVLFALASGMAHLGLSHWFYYDFVNSDPHGIDGGPLGFLTWTIPLLAGSICHDIVNSSPRGRATALCILLGIVVMAVGYGVSSLGKINAALSNHSGNWQDYLAGPPFVHPPVDQNGKRIEPSDLWTMSQRSGSLSYLTFAAGCSFLVYGVFVLLSDYAGLQFGLFRTLGSNALAAYILSSMVAEPIKKYAPKDSPLWYALASFGLHLAILYIFLRYLEKKRLFLKL
ncbi:hypothetical protein KIH39_04500 [Telmatocola sphagniphila]|uniref:Heparan-alpha-glucosaminide N-acetyltransferase catalytic domain-containing protein n=1 Tax=Telmatocola sphagniphila TaxID=1123043 RepID=A0A8E6EU29_9BACT|nr:hypothetical protein [Telmatocola sphagniphila]QVL33184.1 hypothetical protein KIH39_04500 [Telmatocola sphagniphila]